MSEVIDIGDLRIKRERMRYMQGDGCLHKNWTMDDHGGTVSCQTCKQQLTVYWALDKIIDEYNTWTHRFNAERAAFKEVTAKEVVLIAAKRVEKAWRQQSMVPSCPHCHRGILPTDGFGNSTISKELEIKRREKAALQSSKPEG